MPTKPRDPAAIIAKPPAWNRASLMSVDLDHALDRHGDVAEAVCANFALRRGKLSVALDVSAWLALARAVHSSPEAEKLHTATVWLRTENHCNENDEPIKRIVEIRPHDLPWLPDRQPDIRVHAEQTPRGLALPGSSRASGHFTAWLTHPSPETFVLDVLVDRKLWRVSVASEDWPDHWPRDCTFGRAVNVVIRLVGGLPAITNLSYLK